MLPLSQLLGRLTITGFMAYEVVTPRPNNNTCTHTHTHCRHAGRFHVCNIWRHDHSADNGKIQGSPALLQGSSVGHNIFFQIWNLSVIQHLSVIQLFYLTSSPEFCYNSGSSGHSLSPTVIYSSIPVKHFQRLAHSVRVCLVLKSAHPKQNPLLKKAHVKTGYVVGFVIEVSDYLMMTAYNFTTHIQNWQSIKICFKNAKWSIIV